MPALGSPIILDATHGEGGGALLRSAIAMAALTQQALRIVGIRGGTAVPGLRNEDLTLIDAVAESCSAEMVGASIGSNELSFLPTRKPKSLQRSVDPVRGDPNDSVGALVIANALAPLLARTGAYSSVGVSGETHGHGILSFDYFANVTLAAYRWFGLYAVTDLVEAGYGRGSEGLIRFEVEPSALSGKDLGRRGRKIRSKAVLTISELSTTVAERGVAHLNRLAASANLEVEVDVHRPKSAAPGAFVTIWSEFEGAVGGSAAMGKKGLKMESVVQGAFDAFWSWHRSEATLDAFVADQVLLAAAIAEGDTEFTVDRLTQRFLTIVWVIKQFTPIRITVRGAEGEPGVVTIRK